MSTLEKLSSSRVFEGELAKYRFKSDALGGLHAQFNLFLPKISNNMKVPILVYLTGLTGTEDNGAQKGGFFAAASSEGIAILFPDTSPRGAGIEGEDDDWDFGTGAGFYLDATHPRYAKYYNMATHVTQELPHVIEVAGLPIDIERQSIFGHSMGGHGALTLYLASQTATRKYMSASAFAPIANPIKCPWGEKAFKGYLQGGIQEASGKYDATDLIAKTNGPVHILIDYGTGDSFLQQGQLLPENFLSAARAAGHDESQVRVRSQEDYDHSYYFVRVSTFAADHIHFHANYLNAKIT